jgi:hypothetical protein
MNQFSLRSFDKKKLQNKHIVDFLSCENGIFKAVLEHFKNGIKYQIYPYSFNFNLKDDEMFFVYSFCILTKKLKLVGQYSKEIMIYPDFYIKTKEHVLFIVVGNSLSICSEKIKLHLKNFTQ